MARTNITFVTISDNTHIITTTIIIAMINNLTACVNTTHQST